jgi:anti-sigma regulatory factor (Ser/Thr protein kinase)
VTPGVSGLPASQGGHVIDVMLTADNGTSGRRLKLRHPADPHTLRVLRRIVERWAKQNAVPADAVIDLQLALGEAVSNGVEHAYRGGASGTVDVELELQIADALPVVAVRVIDHGRWRPVPLVKGHRGRGLAIIEQLSRGLSISTSERGTQLSFTVPVHTG